MKKLLVLAVCVALALSFIPLAGTIATTDYTVGEWIEVSNYTEIRILGVRYEEYHPNFWEPGRIFVIVSAEVYTTAMPSADIRWQSSRFFWTVETNTGNNFHIAGIGEGFLFIYPNVPTYVEVIYSIPENMIILKITLNCPASPGFAEVTILRPTKCRKSRSQLPQPRKL